MVKFNRSATVFTQKGDGKLSLKHNIYFGTNSNKI